MPDSARIIKVSQPKNKRLRWMESHEAQRLIVEFVLITDFVAGNGRLGVYRNGSSICHLSARHLTGHASKIDAIISRNDTNTAQEENVVYLKQDNLLI